MKVSLTFILFFMHFTHTPPVTQGWRGVVLLHSTRADVERLFGPPTDPGKKASAVYNLEKEVALIFFTSGPPCSMNNGWQVPEGTVAEITVTPKGDITLSDLKIDENKYKKTTDPRNLDYIKYTNEDVGQSINVHYGKVAFITYYPDSTKEHLRCSISRTESGDRIALQDLHALDIYGDIPFEDEKARLDNFAINLLEDPKMKGYIVTYAGRHTRAGKAQARAENAKNYLVNERGIEAERIVTLDGGHREEFTIELYLVPRSAAGLMPKPTTVAPSEVQIIKDGRARNNRRSTQRRCNR